MNFAFSEEQRELARTARRFLEQHAGMDAVRAAMASPAGYDEALWQRICTELGWPGLMIPEAYGGYGYSYLEMMPLLEEMGRALYCGPLFSSVCLASSVLLAAGDEAQKKRWLPAIARGQGTATLAVSERNGGLRPESIHATWTRVGTEYLLQGFKSFVVDGDRADLLIVVARAGGTSGPDGLAFFLVPGHTRGLERAALPTMDGTRRLAEISLGRVKVPASARLGATEDAWPLLASVLDLASVGLSLELVGVAERCLEMAVDYAKVREQFNRPIGSFQAIKHTCADMLLQVESARSAAYYAAWAAVHEAVELPTAAPMALSYCSEAAYFCAAENIQIHGGIGFTWEHDAHLYFKRARAARQLLGDPSHHREVLAHRLGLGEGRSRV